jgi:hypothetical protein
MCPIIQATGACSCTVLSGRVELTGTKTSRAEEEDVTERTFGNEWEDRAVKTLRSTLARPFERICRRTSYVAIILKARGATARTHLVY